ncbi:MAG: family oxidoreductase [Subtercola sp.]|nr:family oxidoreductase [Subtercola sp.]
MLTPECAAFLNKEEDRLVSFVDDILNDDLPGPGPIGTATFFRNLLTDRPDWLPRVQRAVQASTAETLETDGDVLWLAQLVTAGHLADATNGLNPGEISWSSVGWRPFTALPPVEERRPADGVHAELSTLADRYDVVVIGSGAGGGVIAGRLAEAGRSVLVVEAGGWPDAEYLSTDHLRNPRSSWGLESRSGPVLLGNPRVLHNGDTSSIVQASDREWGNNAMTVGGGTRVYGAQAWRFGPIDFRMATHYGIPDGSSLADWPISYDDLEPFYCEAEREIGVSGGQRDLKFAGHRSHPLPMGPLRTGSDHELLERGAVSLGISTSRVPLLVNSEPYDGRAACIQCSLCIGFACRVDAKNGSQNTLLHRALSVGSGELVVNTAVERIVTDARGRVSGVVVVGEYRGAVARKVVTAGEVVIAAGSVETPRLLLNSATDREPQGLGNNTDQVGRHLQAHLYGGAIGLADVDEEILGPGPSIATGDFRHDNPGIVGGGIIVNDFVNTPSNLYRYLADVGLIHTHGSRALRELKYAGSHFVKVSGPIQEMTSRESRVQIDRAVRDRFGNPVAALSGEMHHEDRRARNFIASRSAEWLIAAGAKHVVQTPSGIPAGPSSGQHGAGTCRMGDDAAHSVTDPFGRVWGHENLRVADGSLNVTNGGVNPVLTIFANAFRIAADMIR